MKLGIVCCLHGNEPYGLEVANKLNVSYFMGNEKALELNKRFIDSDLNRCFPGDVNGNHEEQLAYSLLTKLKDFDYVIDLHSCSNKCPLFGIITKANDEKIELAKKLGLEKLVIMSDALASGNALIDNVNLGISLEIGPHLSADNVDKVAEKINNILEDKNRNEDMDIYEVFEIIKKKGSNVLIENFEEVTKGELIANEDMFKQYAPFDFVSILVNEEAYPHILCLAARKIKF
ncbi:MAG: succinylglutamate desuccinylase/aspartoacylase family protein [Nanoarchaeota archaeon]|nr:succinylglutamate desuccinylase/aspartoacylase family protein [Nanoarchaeota archaeon]